MQDSISSSSDELIRAIIEAVEVALDARVASLSDQVAHLRARLQRPDLQKYTIEQACQRMKRSRSSIYELLKAGELTPVKKRGRTYLTEEEIQRWERIQLN